MTNFIRQDTRKKGTRKGKSRIKTRARFYDRKTGKFLSSIKELQRAYGGFVPGSPGCLAGKKKKKKGKK